MKIKKGDILKAEMDYSMDYPIYRYYKVWYGVFEVFEDMLWDSYNGQYIIYLGEVRPNRPIYFPRGKHNENPHGLGFINNKYDLKYKTLEKITEESLPKEIRDYLISLDLK